MFTDAPRFFYGLMSKNFNFYFKSAIDLYSQLRPIIFLPFNVWFFFVSLPFRFFFFFYNTLTGSQNPSAILKAKALELKQSFAKGQTMQNAVIITEKSVEINIPTIEVTKPSPQLRQRASFATEDQPFSWYSLSSTRRVEHPVREETILEEFKSKLDEIQQKREELNVESISTSSDSEQQLEEAEEREKAATEEKQRLETLLNQATANFYNREKAVIMEKQQLEAQLKELSGKSSDDEKTASEEKQRLEAQLKDLSSKYETDEKALALFEEERTRFRQMITVQQKKSFDFQQDIIALKNQLRSEQDSRLKAQEELDSIKKAKAAKNKSRKSKSKKSASTSTSTSVASESAQTESIPEVAVTETKPAWHVQHHESDYTEMVAEAQREEIDHKKFSDVVKDSLQVQPSEMAKDDSEEFTVVGGDLSSKHITLEAPSTTVTQSSETESAPEVAATETKPAWHIKHHESDYTEMIAEAQREEMDHKKFSDVVKDSLQVQPSEMVKDNSQEFTVVGGDLSSKHLLLSAVAPSFTASN